MNSRRTRLSMVKCWRDRQYLQTTLFKDQKLVMLRKMKEAALKPRKKT